MLRLNPTQLRLDARDLSWHIDRHNERQTLRATGPPTNVTNKVRSPKKNQPDARLQDSPYPFPQRPAARTTEVIDKHEDSIISSEPVPHDSRYFWDRVLADAETPTRTQTTSLGNATLIEPSDDFLENNHSSRASIEEDYPGWHDDNNDLAYHSDDPRSLFRDNEVDVSAQWPVPSSSGSLDSTGVDASIDSNETDKEQNLPVEKTVKTASAKRRLSFNNFNFFRRKVTPELDGSSEINVHHSLANRHVDGRYESRLSHDRSRSESSSSSAGGDLRDGLYGSRRDRRTISTNMEACINARSDAEGSGSAHLSNDAASRSMLPTVPTPRQIDDIPRHASGLPRSSLYISQAAMSSSPHKAPETVTGSSEPSASEDLLAIPPRRRKRYKPRSESYPFVSSEDLDMSTLPQLDGPSTAQIAHTDVPSLTVSYPSTHAMVPTPPLGIPVWNYHHIGASPAGTAGLEDYNNGELNGQAQTDYEWSSPHESYQDSVEIRSYRSLSSMGSRHTRIASSHSEMGDIHPSPSHRNLSPFAEPSVPRSARRHASPQLPLPPPFSATPRNLSLNSVLPYSSSISPHTPPSRLTSYSTSPVPHSHAHIPIYNDNLSPTTQPQTPAELSRNRRPRMATQNPFFTAPARPQGRSTRDERLANWQAFGTPTRRSSVRTRNHHDNQENIGAVDAEERRLRRQLALEMRMGREEMERYG